MPNSRPSQNTLGGGQDKDQTLSKIKKEALEKAQGDQAEAEAELQALKDKNKQTRKK